MFKPLALCAALLLATGCTREPEKLKGYRIYVTNESSGDMTIID